MGELVKSKAPRSVIAFHEWMIREGWTKWGTGKEMYYYRSDTYNQWPPDECATEDELLIKFFGI